MGDILKKLNNIIFWCGIFLIIATCVLTKELSDLDEIWNFNMARCICNGLVPYKDISMIITPLTPLIEALFLKIFGSEMFVSRVLAIILALINLILVYRICKNLKIPKTIIDLFIISIVFFIKDLISFDYNAFFITLTLIAILFEIKNSEKNYSNKIYHILIGLIWWDY